MSLVTRCPRCQRAFQVVLDQLRLHEGLVRCGGCSMVFDGFACLETNLPTLTRLATDRPEESTPQPAAPATPQPAPAPPESHGIPRWTSPAVAAARAAPPAPPAVPIYPSATSVAPVAPAASAPLTVQISPQMTATPPSIAPDLGADAPSVMRRRAADPFDDRDREPSLSTRDPYDEQEEEGEPVPPLTVLGESRIRGPEPASVGRSEPEFMTEDEPPGILARALWALASLVAFILLLAQLVFVYRNEIATLSPSLRLAISSACARFGCDVNLVRHLDKITIDSSSLQQVGGSVQEGQPTSLLLNFSMRNRLEKAQSWPSLMLELKDASGTVLVRKDIPAHQYLPSTLVDQPFAAGQEVNLTLPLTVAPGMTINGFQLRVFFP